MHDCIRETVYDCNTHCRVCRPPHGRRRPQQAADKGRQAGRQAGSGSGIAQRKAGESEEKKGKELNLFTYLVSFSTGAMGCTKIVNFFSSMYRSSVFT